MKTLGNPKPLLKTLPKIFGHTDKLVRAEVSFASPFLSLSSSSLLLLFLLLTSFPLILSLETREPFSSNNSTSSSAPPSSPSSKNSNPSRSRNSPLASKELDRLEVVYRRGSRDSSRKRIRRGRWPLKEEEESKKVRRRVSFLAPLLIEAHSLASFSFSSHLQQTPPKHSPSFPMPYHLSTSSPPSPTTSSTPSPPPNGKNVSTLSPPSTRSSNLQPTSSTETSPTSSPP